LTATGSPSTFRSMSGPLSPEPAPSRAKALLAAILVAPFLLVIGAVLVLNAVNSGGGAPATPPPSIVITDPENPDVAVIAPQCRTLPVDSVYAFEGVPLPPTTRFVGDVTDGLLPGFVARRYSLIWPEGGFEGWFGADLGRWALSGGATKIASGLPVAELILDGGESVAATVVVEQSSGDEATVRVEMSGALQTQLEATPIGISETSAIGPRAIYAKGEGDACSYLSAYFFDSSTGGDGTLVDELADPELGTRFRAVPISNESAIGADAVTALRPTRLPDGGWRIPVEAGVTYRFFYIVRNGTTKALEPLYPSCGQGIADPLLLRTPSIDAKVRTRYVLRVDVGQRAETSDAATCAVGMTAILKESGAVVSPERAEAAATELNGLAVGLRFAQGLRYRPELIDRLQAAEVATEQAGPIGSLLVLFGIGGGLAMAAFAFYLFRRMDRRRRPVRTGKGLARPNGGRR
jgi:hypothetical protein